MRTINISNKPKSINYFDIVRQNDELFNQTHHENEIRIQWLNGEFEKLDERLSNLSAHLSQVDFQESFILIGKRNLQNLMKFLRLIDSKFVEVDYLDHTNKKIALNDIEDEVRDLKKQIEFLEKDYIVH